MLRYLKIKTLCFEAAHYLREELSDKCCRIHGHTYRLENIVVCCKANVFVDFAKIKECLCVFDHGLLVPEKHERTINLFFSNAPIEELRKTRVFGIKDDTTIENISTVLKDIILSINDVIDIRFDLYEGENCGVEV